MHHWHTSDTTYSHNGLTSIQIWQVMCCPYKTHCDLTALNLIRYFETFHQLLSDPKCRDTGVQCFPYIHSDYARLRAPLLKFHKVINANALLRIFTHTVWAQRHTVLFQTFIESLIRAANHVRPSSHSSEDIYVKCNAHAYKRYSSE